MPKVSICIPAYQQVEYLRRTLDSIQAQSFQDFEIILTDDSPDDAVQHLVELYPFGPKLHYTRNIPALGSPANWNSGMQKASGEYIKILHHDDWFSRPESLDEFVRMLDEHPETDFAFSAAFVEYATDGRQRRHDVEVEKVTRLQQEPTSLFYFNVVGAPSATIFRRSALELFDVNLQWLVDFECYIRLLVKNPRVVFSPEPLVTTITDAPHSITNLKIHQKDADVFEYFYIFNKIARHIPPARQRKYEAMLGDVMIRYRIKSIREIRECNYTGDVPPFVRMIITLNRLIPSSLMRRLMYFFDPGHQPVI